MTIINSTREDFDKLYNGSAWTWEGMSVDEKNLKDICNWFKSNGCPLIEDTFYVTKGSDMNEWCGGLTGNNAYPDDLSILSIELDNITNVSKIYLNKFQVGARWFDDIVDNNRRRENNA